MASGLSRPTERAGDNRMAVGIRTTYILALFALLLILSPGAFAAPPADPSAVSITAMTVESQVPMNDFIGVNFYVANSTGGYVANHHCTVSIYEWRDNVSYPLAEHKLIPMCESPDIYKFTGEGNASTPVDCWLQTAPNGEFYFMEQVTRDKGYNVAPKTGSYIGGYGTYKLEAKCGLGANMSGTANFTVLQEKEPTFLMDWLTFAVSYPAYDALALVILFAFCTLIYFALRFLGWGD